MVRAIILCGGVGRRFSEKSLYCKPLSLVYGRPLIEYTLKPFVTLSIPLLIAYNEILGEQNFVEIVRNLYPEAKIDFYAIPYLTRGAVETGLLTVDAYIKEDEPIIFFDNDAIYDLSSLEAYLTVGFKQSFLGYSNIDVPLPCYCYMKLDNSIVVDIREKEIISNHWGVGIYGFHSSNYFKEQASIMVNNKIMMRGEYYFSGLYSYLINKEEKIEGVQVNTPVILGTPEQVLTNMSTSMLNSVKDNPSRIVLVSKVFRQKYGEMVSRLETELGLKINDLEVDGDIILDERAINFLDQRWKSQLGFFNE